MFNYRVIILLIFSTFKKIFNNFLVINENNILKIQIVGQHNGPKLVYLILIYN